VEVSAQLMGDFWLQSIMFVVAFADGGALA